MYPIPFTMTAAVKDIVGRVSKITDKFSPSPSRVYLTTETTPNPSDKTRRKMASTYHGAVAPVRSLQPTSRPPFSVPVPIPDAPKIDLDFEVPLLHAEHHRMTLKAKISEPLAHTMEVSESKPKSSFELIVTPATPIDESNPYFAENDGNGYVVDEEGNYWAAVDMNHLSLQWKTLALDERLQLAEEEGQIIQWPTFWGDDDESVPNDEDSLDEDDELAWVINDLLMSERMQKMFDYC